RYSPNSNQSIVLKNELKGTQGKALVVLSRNLHFLNWNDPFLRGNVIFVRDIENRREQIVNAFPDYAPRYFRESAEFNDKKKGIEYSLKETPDMGPRGFVSLFKATLMMESTHDRP